MDTNKVVRRVDDLGRIHLPKEIRRELRIKEGDQMEIYIIDGVICLRPRSDVNETLG